MIGAAGSDDGGSTAGGGGGCTAAGASMTFRKAPLLTTDPAEFVAIALYVAASASVTFVSVRVAPTHEGTVTPFFCHTRSGAGLPDAAAVNTIVPPASTDLLTGCTVNAGASP